MGSSWYKPKNMEFESNGPISGPKLFWGPYMAKGEFVEKNILNIVVDDENERVHLKSPSIYNFSGEYSLNKYWENFRNKFQSNKWKDEKWILPIGEKITLKYDDNNVYVNGVKFELIQAVCVNNLWKLRNFMNAPLEFDVNEGIFTGGDFFNKTDSLMSCNELITNYVYRGEINDDEVLISFILPFNNFVAIRSKKKGGFYHKNYKYWFNKTGGNLENPTLDNQVFYQAHILKENAKLVLDIKDKKYLDYQFTINFLGTQIHFNEGGITEQEAYKRYFKSVIVFFHKLIINHKVLNDLEFYVKYGFVKSRLTDAIENSKIKMISNKTLSNAYGLLKKGLISSKDFMAIKKEEDKKDLDKKDSRINFTRNKQKTRNIINKLISHQEIGGKLRFNDPLDKLEQMRNYIPVKESIQVLSSKMSPSFYFDANDRINADRLVEYSKGYETPNQVSNSSSSQVAKNDNTIITVNTVAQGKSESEAIKFALRDALEQSFGTFISSKTEILNDELFKDEIVSISSGNIIGYDILSKVKLDGAYSVSVKAKVSVSSFADYMQNKGHEVSFSGQSFGMKIKLQRLNEAAEVKAVDNMIVVLKSLFKKSVDFKLADPSEPVQTSSNLNLKYVSGTEESFYIRLFVDWSFNKNFIVYNQYMIETMKGMSMSENEIINYSKQKRDLFKIDFVDMSKMIELPGLLPIKKIRNIGLESSTKLFFRNKKTIYKFVKFFKDAEKVITNFKLVINSIDNKPKVFTPKLFDPEKGKGYANIDPVNNPEFYHIKEFKDKTILRYLDSYVSLPSPHFGRDYSYGDNRGQKQIYYTNGISLNYNVIENSLNSLFFPYNGYYNNVFEAGSAYVDFKGGINEGIGSFNKYKRSHSSHEIVLTFPVSVLEKIEGFEIKNLN